MKTKYKIIIAAIVVLVVVVTLVLINTMNKEIDEKGNNQNNESQMNVNSAENENIENVDNTQNEIENNYRVSIRSRGVKINHIAQMFRGGGHAYASGATLLSLDELDTLIEKLKGEVYE